MDWVERFFDGEFYAQDYLEVVRDTERTVAEAAFIISELALTKDDAVLDLACGSGRHALAIAPHVKHVTGVDRTSTVIETALKAASEESVENVTFSLGDMRQLDHDQQFDAAFNYFTAWGYYDDETNLDVLRRVFRSLRPGGRFLLEIMNRAAVLRRFRAYDWVRNEDGTHVLHKRRLDLATGRFHSTYVRLKDGKEASIDIDHYVPSPDALVRHFRDAGFGEVRLVSAPDGGEAGLDSWRIAVIGTRRD